MTHTESVCGVADQKAPKKQRHTAKRIFERLKAEYGYLGGKTVVEDAVRAWRQTHQEVFLPLVHPPGEAQVDFGEATIRQGGAQGKRVRFFRVTEIITQLLEAKEERQLQRYRLALSKLDLLVLDELVTSPPARPEPNSCSMSLRQRTNAMA